MKKVILINAIVTFVGFFLDVFGVFNLSLTMALISVIMGIIDVITFFWLREEIKEWFKRRRKT